MHVTCNCCHSNRAQFMHAGGFPFCERCHRFALALVDITNRLNGTSRAPYVIRIG